MTSLEVRVVPTDGGYYLFARDDRGFTRDRLVPDGATAGALVASWMADDSIDGVWIPREAVVPVVAPDLAPVPGSDVVPAVATAAARPRFALAVGGVASPTTGGARLDLEVPIRRSAVHVTASVGAMMSDFGADLVRVHSREARFGLGLGRAWDSATWRLRVAGGVLARVVIADVQDLRTAFEDTSQPWPEDLRMTHERTGLLCGGEVSVLASRRVYGRWAATAGMFLSDELYRDGLPRVDYIPDLTFFGGVSLLP